MNPSDLAAEYGNIKAFCRQEAAKSFKHPLAPKPEAPAEPSEAAEAADLNDDELAELLRGDAT